MDAAWGQARALESHLVQGSSPNGWLVGYLHGINDQALQYVQNAGIDKLRARSREYVSYHLCRTTKRNGCSLKAH